ncbi:MAG: hypothetical protein U5Q44_16305 [Dehalococcoidia bacterium]|nr:hypothetical protein [Dehalococcoidia bacterium]
MGFEALGGRAAADRAKWGDRLPPGQHEATRWPVLHRGKTPHIDCAAWRIARSTARWKRR